MKNKRQIYLIVSIICFAAAVFFAVLYGVTEVKETRLLAGIGFTACAIVFFKMFLDYLKEIHFGKKIFGPLRKLFAKLYAGISGKVKHLLGHDEDKIYTSAKKDEFQIKFEIFKGQRAHSEKKNKVKLPKYSTLTEEKEKIRYIYTVFLKKKIEKGYTLDSSRTPSEISEDFAGSEKAQALFAAYPVARYASDTDPLDVESKNFEDMM